MKIFNSLDEIKNASQEELMEVKGITCANAAAIREYFG